MPNTKSAEKRVRQNAVRRQMNRQNISRMRTSIKGFRKLVADSKLKEAGEMLPGLYSIIDKSVQKGVIHANTAARYKSRLTRHLAVKQS